MKTVQYKKLISATAIALALGLVNPASAMDTPSVSFYPVASWDVSNIKNPNAGTTHCLVLNEYNNGFFIQLQGSENKMESISIDFRQDAFSVGQNEDVVLSIPGKMNKTFSATAFSADVLSINMIGEDTFFDMLRSASALDVQIGDNAFRFFLTGFANALKSYDRCLDPSKAAPAIMTQTPAAPVSEPIEETAEVVVEEIVQEVAQDSQAIEDAPGVISSSEPVREAPSEFMNEMSEKAQERYAKELSVILQEPEEKVTAELQKALEQQEQAIIDDKALSQRPTANNQSYTQQLAEQMGTPTSKTAEPVMAASLSTVAPIVEMSVDTVSEDESIVETKPETVDVEIKEPAPQTLVETNEAEEIIWNGPAVSKKVEIVNAAPEPVEALDAPKEQSLVDDLKSFIDDNKNEPEEIVKTVSIQKDVKEPSTEDLPMLPPAVEPKPEPVKTSYTTPEIKVNKEVFRSEADFTDMDLPVKEVKAAPARMPVADMAVNDEELRMLQKKVARLKRDNKALNMELESALRSGEKERMDISSDNWNLEQATMKYNEAERQIAKLGQQIQKERAQYEYEKKELEMMLFDPQVTEEAQLARLGSLEKKIEKLQTEMQLQEEQYERQIQMLKSRLSQ